MGKRKQPKKKRGMSLGGPKGARSDRSKKRGQSAARAAAPRSAAEDAREARVRRAMEYIEALRLDERGRRTSVSGPASADELGRREAGRTRARQPRLHYEVHRDGLDGGRQLVVDVAISDAEDGPAARPLVDDLRHGLEGDLRVVRVLPLGERRSWFRTRAEDPPGRYRLEGDQIRRAVPWIARSGRARLSRAAGAEVEPPTIRWTGDGVWRPELSLERGEASVSLQRGEERLEIAADDPPVVAGDFFITGSDAGVVSSATALRYALDWCAAPPPDVAAALAAAPRGLGVRFDEARAGRARLVLRVESPAGAAELPVAVCFDYEGAQVERRQEGVVVAHAEGPIRRDMAAERRIFDELVARDIVLSPLDRPRVRAARLADLVEAASSLDGWVEAERRRLRGGGSSALSVESGEDWFELRGGVRFESSGADISSLVAAARDGRQWVTLDDGSLGLLPSEWLERWSLLALASRKRGALRFGRSQGWLLESWLEKQSLASDVARDARSRAWAERVGRLQSVTPTDPPAGFTGELRDYQREGLGWIGAVTDLGLGGCLADDMGLGKTVQVLAWLAANKGPGTSLVVAPRSVAFQWVQEAERFAPALRVVEHAGARRARTAEELAELDLVVTSYGTLRRDVDWLADIEFDAVVIDEAHAVKNPRSATATAVRRLSTERRIALTGTPVENHLGELWSLCEFMNPGMLGSARGYSALLRVSGERSREERERRVAPIRDAIAPFFLRRTKSEVLASLPPKTEQTILLTLSQDERQRYQALRSAYVETLRPKAPRRRSSATALEALLRLRQAACHPGLIDPARSDERSTKVEELVARLTAIAEEGHKALVFSQFTKLLAVVRGRLDEEGVTYEYLDGRTRDRGRRVERFQQDADCTAFLVSLKAGGHGLNLTAADFVFLLDPWWNPAVESQAIDRAHRLGRERPVVAYRLVARQTVEEKMLALQARKRELAESVLAEGPGTERTLDWDALSELLGE